MGQNVGQGERPASRRDVGELAFGETALFEQGRGRLDEIKGL